MLLPCDLPEWLPGDHLVHFILDVVEQIPTGSEKYPPTMMLALRIYWYAAANAPVAWCNDGARRSRLFTFRQCEAVGCGRTLGQSFVEAA